MRISKKLLCIVAITQTNAINDRDGYQCTVDVEVDVGENGHEKETANEWLAERVENGEEIEITEEIFA